MDESIKILGQFAGVGGVPIVVMLTNMVKARVPADYWPALALFWGVVVSLVFALVLQTDLRIAVGTGIVSGYLAQQQYDKGHDASKGDYTPVVQGRLDQYVPRG